MINYYAVFYADQFTFTKICAIMTGLWEFQGFKRPNIALCGAPYSRFYQIYLFCWKVQKNSGNTTLSNNVSWDNSNFVWLLKSKEFFQHVKNVWNYFLTFRKFLRTLFLYVATLFKEFWQFSFQKLISSLAILALF